MLSWSKDCIHFKDSTGIVYTYNIFNCSVSVLFECVLPSAQPPALCASGCTEGHPLWGGVVLHVLH